MSYTRTLDGLSEEWLVAPEYVISKTGIPIEFPIEGLRFEENLLLTREIEGGGRERKIISNDGGCIHHYVTHDSNFEYDTFGIHLGQEDRLTFWSQNEKYFSAYFMDCRIGSPTSGKRCIMQIPSSPVVKLIVPCGIAHSFGGINDILTRNDMHLYIDIFSKTNDFLLDNRTFGVSAIEDDIPRFPPNRYRLPMSAGLLLFEAHQQSLLRQQDAIATRMAVRVGDQTVTVLVTKETKTSPSPTRIEFDLISGIQGDSSPVSLVGQDSWCVVPSVDSCVSDLVLLSVARSSIPAPFNVHMKQSVIHTLLSGASGEVELELWDLRRDSPTFATKQTKSWAIDPRQKLEIPAGVAYRYYSAEEIALRVEYRLFMAKDDTSAYPLLGDYEALDGNLEQIPIPVKFEHELPKSVLQWLAGQEWINLSNRFTN